MVKNLLTKFFDLKHNNLPPKTRKTYRNKSKIIRKSRKIDNIDNNDDNCRDNASKNIKNKRMSPIEILKRTPNSPSTRTDVKNLKNIKQSRNQRKSFKTSTKNKILKRRYFDMWNSDTFSYNFPSKSSYKPYSLYKPTTQISNMFSDSAILSKLSGIKLDKTNENDIDTIKTMQFMLKKIKEDNDKIEKLLNNQLNLDEIEKETKEDPTIYKCLKNPMVTIKNLIELGEEYEKYKDDEDTYFNIDLKALNNMIEPLKNLDSMVGLKDVKDDIIEQILFYIQHLENKNNDFLHTTLYGNPGVGKTELGRIIGKIYSSLGFLSSGHVIEAHAEDFIGSVVGQTAIKTRAILDKAIGGVLVIDEAYALGNKDGKSYVDDFITTLLPFLTEHRNDFICILMGYKKDIEDNLFSKNKGLKRRFPNSYSIRDYNTEELRDILIKKIKEYEWYYDTDSISLDLFNKCKKDNPKVFEDNGGSMEILFKHIKRSHSKRVLYYPPEKKRTINQSDFENGLKSYLKILKSDENHNNYKHMYS
jgi:hypothetical protein